MTNDEGRKPEGAPERSPKAGEGAPSGVDGNGPRRFSVQRKLGVDVVKIDGSFVQNLARSADDRLFVRTMIELAKGLGIATVAEWVQDEETAAILTEWGCDYLQGNLVGRATLERPQASAA